MGVIRSFVDSFWEMLYDFLLEEGEGEEKVLEDYELSPESFYIETEKSTKLSLNQSEELEYF